ncbi:MAG: hypothetical protein RR872_02840, partial [Mucinivorans sp.]
CEAQKETQPKKKGLSVSMDRLYGDREGKAIKKLHSHFSPHCHPFEPDQHFISIELNRFQYKDED